MGTVTAMFGHLSLPSRRPIDRMRVAGVMCR